MNELIESYLIHVQARNTIMSTLVSELENEIKFSNFLIECVYELLKAGEDNNENKAS